MTDFATTVLLSELTTDIARKFEVSIRTVKRWGRSETTPASYVQRNVLEFIKARKSQVWRDWLMLLFWITLGTVVPVYVSVKAGFAVAAGVLVPVILGTLGSISRIRAYRKRL